METMKMLTQYTGAESLYDVAVNRMNSFGDSLLDEGINRTAKHMSAKVAMKGFASNLVSGIASSIKSMADNLKEKLEELDTSKE